MLVLTRRVGEALIIGENISLRVLSVSGGAVRVGISAPRDVHVLREELCKNAPREERPHHE
jgi:carbon storage regulator